MTEESALTEIEKEPVTPVVEESTEAEGKTEEVKEEKPKENRYSKRVKELNTKFREAERRAEDAEKKLSEQAEANKLKKAPDPDDYDDGEVPESDKKKWDDQVRADIRNEERIRIKQENADKKQQEKLENGKNAYIKSRADYVKENPEFRKYEVEIDDAVEQWRAPEIQNIILEAKELGPAIVTHFGNNPDDLLDIASSSPAKRFFKMGQLITKLEAKPVKKTSSAPDPTRPEKGSAKKIAATGGYDPKKETFKEFARRSNGL
jgi:hypothetical protein